MTELTGKTVLITGAGGGFGQQMTRQFREAGCKLILTDLNERALRGVVEDAGEAHSQPAKATLRRVDCARGPTSRAAHRRPEERAGESALGLLWSRIRTCVWRSRRGAAAANAAATAARRWLPREAQGGRGARRKPSASLGQIK